MNVKKTHRVEMVEKIKAAHAAGMAKLKAFYGTEFYLPILERIEKDLEVELSERMTTTGGRAMMRKIAGEYRVFIIKINARLFEIHPKDLEPTYLHELAHIVTNAFAGTNTGHGNAWADTMHLLGLPAERCHSLDTSALERRIPRITYKCVKCDKEYRLTKHKHLKQLAAALLGRQKYYCRCNGQIQAVPGSKLTVTND